MHLVPALIGMALLCVAVAWPAVAKPPPGKGPRAHAAPGKVKKAARSKATEAVVSRTATADRVAKSVCPYCAVGCAQNVYVKDENAARNLLRRLHIEKGSLASVPHAAA